MLRAESYSAATVSRYLPAKVLLPSEHAPRCVHQAGTARSIRLPFICNQRFGISHRRWQDFESPIRALHSVPVVTTLRAVPSAQGEFLHGRMVIEKKELHFYCKDLTAAFDQI